MKGCFGYKMALLSHCKQLDVWLTENVLVRVKVVIMFCYLMLVYFPHSIKKKNSLKIEYEEFRMKC